MDGHLYVHQFYNRTGEKKTTNASCGSEDCKIQKRQKNTHVLKKKHPKWVADSSFYTAHTSYIAYISKVHKNSFPYPYKPLPLWKGVLVYIHPIDFVDVP